MLEKLIGALNYVAENAIHNAPNMLKAGFNRPIWGQVGGTIAGLLLGGGVLSLLTTPVGWYLGGLLASGVHWAIKS